VPPARRVHVEVEGHELSLSNLDKVMYPEVGFTKGQVIDYYTRVAPAVLPHLRDRPLTLKRYPNGVEGGHFYEKQCPSHRPDWVRSEPVELSSKTIDFCVCDDLPTLVWLANLADLELHPSLSKVPEVERPTVMAFDLDPGPGSGLAECCEVAVILREALQRLGLECFAKTSGSKGIQVYVPLNVDDVDYDHGTKLISNALARHLEAAHPKLIVSSQRKELRRNKVLIDWSQNDEHKTTVGVYSLRARERPTVSTPLAWDELEAGDPDALVFEADEVLARVEEHGDLFAPVAELRQSLPEL
jgi:bifunctional non-homologous end joining protein LigD